MTSPIPPSLVRFGDELDRAARRELSGSSTPTRTRVARPRLLAGSTLGLAGLSAALVLALGGTAATAPAFAVTHQADGSVLVTVNTDETTQGWAMGANQKLASMGIHEAIDGIDVAPGPATSSQPVSCTPGSGAGSVATANGPSQPTATPSGPPVKVLLGKDGTDVVPSGTTGGGGTVHLVSCVYFSTTTPAGTGNTGPGN